MNRDFAILGLKEDATKEQVKQAYERRAAKYRSADFNDDPAYANKKINQLKSAYERAYAIAGTSAAKGNDTETASEDRYNQSEYRPREYKPEDYNHDEFERGRQRAIDKEEGRMHMPDLHKLKDVAKSAGQLKEIVVKKVDEFNRGGDVSEEKAETSQATERKGAFWTPYNDNEKSALVKVIVAVIIALVMLLTQCGDDSDSMEWEDDYGTVYSYEYTTDQDETTHSWALDTTNSIYEKDVAESYEVTEYTQEELHRVSDRFAKRYLGTDSVEEKATDLCNSYGEFPVDGSGNLEEIVTEILAFYQFADLDGVTGYINPYNSKVITNIVEYLQYINQYYYYEIMETKKGA